MSNRDVDEILEMLDFDLELDEEDIDSIVVDLQRIIHDDSVNKGGFQAKFARMIVELNQKRNRIRELKDIQEKLLKYSSKELVSLLIEKLQREIEQSRGKAKFQKLLKLTQIREALLEKYKSPVNKQVQ